MASISANLFREIDTLWANVFDFDPLPIDEPIEIMDETVIFYLTKLPENTILSAAAITKYEIQIGVDFYDVYGIWNVASSVKGLGYGQILLKGITNWLSTQGYTGIGFCKEEIAPFYHKCNFKIGYGLVEQFRERYIEGKLSKHPDNDKDVIAYNDRQDIVGKLINQPQLLAIVEEFW